MSSIRPFRGAARSRRSGLKKLFDYLLAAVFLGLVMLVAARVERFASREAAGVAIVNDGDSLTIGGERIRLRGIDAPELDQICRRDGRDYACGRLSKAALVERIGGLKVDCNGWERDRFRRLLAVCRAGESDLNLTQIETGWAIAYGGYADAEDKARAAKAGLWAGSFDRPHEWRERHGSATEPAHDLFEALFNLLRELFRF
jgi:endonuclease YncB( thermonuclease family)